MTNGNTHTDRSNVDHRLLADRLICHRAELRAIPGDLFTATELARAMIIERDMCDPEDCADYNTNRHLDALIAVMGSAALYLSGKIADVVGEDDSDLPTIERPEPAPAVEVSAEEQRAVWERIAAQAAAELAKLDEGTDQDEANSPPPLTVDLPGNETEILKRIADREGCGLSRTASSLLGVAIRRHATTVGGAA